MPHRHSRQHKTRKEQARRKRSDRIDPLTPHKVLLNQSWKDWVNGEIVHTEKTEQIVYDVIKLLFGDGFEVVCGNLQYGQVLNRFSGCDVKSVVVKWH